MPTEQSAEADRDSDVAIRLTGVCKSYGATRALRDIDVDVRAGTVHALVGENGAGKSTLGKIIAGVISPTSGRIELFGEAVVFAGPHEALGAGVAIVSQEIALVPSRPVLENVFLGRDVGRDRVPRREQREVFDRLSDRTGFRVDRNAVVADLNIADQQKVEILRALARDARVLVFDEPTAALSSDERAQLRSVITQLASLGTTIVLVSHHLEEVLAVADRVTVLRDGRLVSTRDAAGLDESVLIRDMLGRSPASAFPPHAPHGEQPTVLRARNVSSRHLRDIDLELHAGEILGVAGLLGSGRSSLGGLLTGAAPATSGVIELAGEKVRLDRPARALKAGITSVPESRKIEGLVAGQSVLWNVLLPWLGMHTRFGLVDLVRARSHAADALTAVSGDPRRLAADVASLSGGNQQKVLIARSAFTTPRVIVADEPTRGIDIGAKEDIYRYLADFASTGGAVLMISSELDELVGMADRILVMRDGAIVGEFPRGVTEEELLLAAFGQNTREESR